MSILSSHAICECVRTGRIEIDPFNAEQLNPCSYDLTLGDTYALYTGSAYAHGEMVLDSKRKQPVDYWTIPEEGVRLTARFGYLMHTRERVLAHDLVPIVDGKSSIGRLFVWVHVTAGFGDPGFNGQYTLEVVPLYDTILYPGMRICQIRFETIDGVIQQYTGNYCGNFAKGPVPSRSWAQFKR